MADATAASEEANLEVIAQAVTPVAEGVIAIDLARADGLPFEAWAPGAHVDVVIGPGLVRQYSLCGPLDNRSHLRIAVLREPQSRGGSQALHERLKPGDRLEIRGPRNAFPLPEASEYVLIAGGIGITPLLPMVAQLARTGARWKLLYGGRTRRSMAFTETLAVHGARVSIRPEDETGLLDIAGWIGPARAGCAILCCGPERLIAAVEAQCAAWPEGALQIERFRPPPADADRCDSAFEVVLARRGLSVQVSPGQSIADALDTVGVHIPRSCNEGTCGTCITKVLEGEPDHRDSFLRGRMRLENRRIMVCCSRAKSQRLVLDV